MARPLRLEFPGALYHVTSRGDGREDIYLETADRHAFLDVLGRVCERFNWAIHAYCLMSNHYHLLVETPDANLAKGMRQLNGVYTQQFNRRHRRVGHVFQGRYKAIIVERDAYLLELARYVVLNPVRARLVRSAKDWPWSSYRATAGLTAGPPWLQSGWLLSTFSRRVETARMRYRAFVAEGKNQPDPWAHLKNQIYLGSDQFIASVQVHLDPEAPLDEIPRAQQRPPVKPLAYFAQRYPDRDTAVVAAYASGGYSMREIGEHFGLHYSRVSRIISGTSRATE